MSSLTSFGAYKARLASALGLPLPDIARIGINDLIEQARNAPRPLPSLSTGGVELYDSPQHYGAPHYGGFRSGINPPLSRAEFVSHFLFSPDGFPELLSAFDYLRTPGRPSDQDFAYKHDANGVPIRWVSQETALLVFLKRMRIVDGDAVMLQPFFGRTIEWISDVFDAVSLFISTRWVPTKIQALDCRIFNCFRLKDYEECLWRAGLRISCCAGFVDNLSHSTRRPGTESNLNAKLQSVFFNSADKVPNYELVTFPDGIIGRAYRPVVGRHYEVFRARKRRLVEFVRGALRGSRLLGDKSYLGFGLRIRHPHAASLPDSSEAQFNTHISSCSTEVENDIASIFEQFVFLQCDMNREMQHPEAWFEKFEMAIFMHNVHTCVTRSSETALRFGMPLLPLRRYLS